MRVPYNDLLNRQGQRYCVKDDEFFKLLEWLKLQLGGQWRLVALEARISSRHMRYLRSKVPATVSEEVMDKVLGRTGFPHKMGELKWYTPDELVEMGVWKQHNIKGLTDLHARRRAERREERATS